MFWSREGEDEENRVLKIPARAEVHRSDRSHPNPVPFLAKAIHSSAMRGNFVMRICEQKF